MASTPTTAVVSCAVRPTDLDTNDMPRALLPIGGQPLIKHTLMQLVDAGVTRIVLVIGYRGQLIRDQLTSSPELKKVTLDIVDLGDAWRAGFSASLLAARKAVHTEDFLLCTFDHVFDPSIIKRMLALPATANGTTVLVDTSRREPIAGSGECTLLSVVDEDNTVTKVNPAHPVEASGIEAGLFKSTAVLFDVLEELSNQKPYFKFAEVLSELAQRGTLHAMPVDGSAWFAVENFLQLAHAREHAATGLPLLTRAGSSNPPRRSFIAPVSSDPEAITSRPDGISKVIGPGGAAPATKLNICLVGLGRAGQFHLRSISMLTDKVRLVWVVDVNEEQVAKITNQYDCQGTADLDIPLNDPNVDAVIIASTTFLHYDHIIRSLKAGKAVLAEKPISHDPAELTHVIETAHKNKIPFLAGYQRRCDKNFRALKQQMVAGSVGGTRVIKCTSRDNPEPPLEYLRISGGIFHDMLCHDFDMIHYLTGEFPESVYSIGHTYNKAIAEMDDIDTAVVTLRFASGILATVDTSRIAAYGYDQRIEVFGDKGMCQAHNMSESSIMVASVEGYTTPRSEWSFPQRYPQAYLTELAEFVEMAKNNLPEEEPSVMRHIMLEKVTTAAELSYRLGRPVRVDEVESLRSHLPKH